MKHKLFLTLITVALIYSSPASSININSALKQKLVQLEVRWHVKSKEETSSLRHGTNLAVSLLNTSNAPLTVEIPEGFLFTAHDSSRQNMLITEQLVYELMPKQSSCQYAHGYCCEFHDAGPQENDVYQLKKAATDKLTQLAKFAAQNKLEGYAVQRAIWCVSDKTDLSSINSEDSSEVRKLIDFTGALMNYSPLDINKAHQKSLNGNKNFENVIRLEIPVNSDESQVWIVIQNVNNTNVQTVMCKQKPGKGLLVKQFGVSSIDLGKGEFTVRVYSTDRPVQEKKFKLDV